MWRFWEDSDLSVKLNKLLNTGFASDLKIIVIQPNKLEKELKAHKIFLQMGSSVLDLIIRENGDQIVFENVELEIVKLMLKYLYTGKFDLRWKYELLPVIKLLQLATKYGIKGLVVKCENALKSWELNNEELLPLFGEAKLCRHNPTIERTIKYIFWNGFKMLKRPDFSNLSQECVIEIIKEYELRVDNELQVFEAVYKWGEAECFRQSLDANDPQTMQIILAQVLPHVRFPLLKKYEFEQKVCPTKILEENEVLKLLTFMDSSNNIDKSSPQVGRFTATRRRPRIDYRGYICLILGIILGQLLIRFDIINVSRRH